jgi:YggT family protein
MSSFGLAIMQLGGLINGLIEVYIWVMIASALISFVNPDPFNPIVQFLYRVTNPAYAMVNRYINTNFNGIDLAPLVVIIALQVLQIVINLIFNILATSL